MSISLKKTHHRKIGLKKMNKLYTKLAIRRMKELI